MKLPKNGEPRVSERPPSLTGLQIRRLRALAELSDDDLVAACRRAEVSRASTQVLAMHGLIKLRPSDYGSARRHAFITALGREWLLARAAQDRPSE